MHRAWLGSEKPLASGKGKLMRKATGVFTESHKLTMEVSLAAASPYPIAPSQKQTPESGYCA